MQRIGNTRDMECSAVQCSGLERSRCGGVEKSRNVQPQKLVAVPDCGYGPANFQSYISVRL